MIDIFIHFVLTSSLFPVTLMVEINSFAFQNVSRRKDVSPMPRRTNPRPAANSTVTNADGVDETITVYSDPAECP